MKNGYIEIIKNRIDKSPEGTIFIYSDFADIADASTIRKSVQRLISDEKLNRILDGIFEKPKFNNRLNQNIPANPDDVATAIARSFHWDIAPCDDVALNLMGLSTQIPSNWTYVSSGPYRKYEWNNIELNFKHRTSREITNISPKSLLIVQALKALGRDRIDDEVIEKIRETLNEQDRKKILSETRDTSAWIFAAIKRICEA